MPMLNAMLAHMKPPTFLSNLPTKLSNACKFNDLRPLSTGLSTENPARFVENMTGRSGASRRFFGVFQLGTPFALKVGNSGQPEKKTFRRFGHGRDYS